MEIIELMNKWQLGLAFNIFIEMEFYFVNRNKMIHSRIILKCQIENSLRKIAKRFL